MSAVNRTIRTIETDTPDQADGKDTALHGRPCCRVETTEIKDGRVARRQVRAPVKPCG